MTQHTAEIWAAVALGSLSFALISLGINKLVYAFDIINYTYKRFRPEVIIEETKKGKK